MSLPHPWQRIQVDVATRENNSHTFTFNVDHAPYSGAFTPYTTGLTGWVPMLQTVLAF